jgi:hypothetical protein
MCSLDTEKTGKARERSNDTLHMDWEMEKENMHVVNIEEKRVSLCRKKRRMSVFLLVLLIVMMMF